LADMARTPYSRRVTLRDVLWTQALDYGWRGGWWMGEGRQASPHPVGWPVMAVVR
jgi:hypothetical protein